MNELITNDLTICVGCNRCIRACPVEGANIAYSEDDEIKVKIDQDQCIACGACILTCQHDSRCYRDDTERFLSDLQSGMSISLMAAPAIRTNGENWGRLLTWLRQRGVRKIYDVSIGADICIWAHIRYIEKERPASIITQPCPVIVSYIEMHRHELLPYLSPVHSPMLCTAVFMKNYEKISDKIAALSPCIAKAGEFERTQQVDYNVTLKKLYEYIEENNIVLPMEESGFDSAESSLGCLFPMPGGLKENIELYLGKVLRIDKIEGQDLVYKALDEFAQKDEKYLPDIFDVLNCFDGCNSGTGCSHEFDMFEINSIMDSARHDVLKSHDRGDYVALFKEYDDKLRLNDFLRTYQQIETRHYSATDEQIEHGFMLLDKEDDIDRLFDCSACGADTCLEMAKKIACGLNIPENCIQKVRNDIHREHDKVLDLSATNIRNIEGILKDISKIKGLSDDIIKSVSSVNTAIEMYSEMANRIDEIAMQINIISFNASIEAARAGQHGKTFSVVADEIRNLANSSKKSVSETGQISDHAIESINEINVMIDQISDEVKEAYLNISDISEKTQAALVNSDLGRELGITK